MSDFIANLFKALQSGNFVTMFSALIVLFIACPVILIVVIKKWRLWFNTGVVGDNKKLDWDEIIKLYALFGNFICLLLYSYMVITHGLNGTEWGWEDKLITAGIAAGADAALITSLIVKYKSNQVKE